MIEAVFWLSRAIFPVRVRESRSSKLTVSPTEKSAFAARTRARGGAEVVGASGGGSAATIAGASGSSRAASSRASIFPPVRRISVLRDQSQIQRLVKGNPFFLSTMTLPHLQGRVELVPSLRNPHK